MRDREIKEVKIRSEEIINIKPDSIDQRTYVGFVNRYEFQNTDEFFVTLYSKKEHIEDGYSKKIRSLGDSTVYRDDENYRIRIPRKIAISEFDLYGLNTLLLFDEHNRMITKASLVRVEYLSQTIVGGFTAVYKADNPNLIDSASYCIGNLGDKTINRNFVSFDDSSLTTYFDQKIAIAAKERYGAKHYRLNDHKSISIYYADTTTLVLQKSNNKMNILYQEEAFTRIVDIQLVPIFRNAYPLLLTRTICTDYDWDDLYIFESGKYKRLENQRFK